MNAADVMAVGATLPCDACGSVLGEHGRVMVFREGSRAEAVVQCGPCVDRGAPQRLMRNDALAPVLAAVIPCRQCEEATGPSLRWSIITCSWGFGGDPYVSVRCIACSSTRAPDEGEALDDGTVVPSYVGATPATAARLAEAVQREGLACSVCCAPVGHGPGMRDGVATVSYLPDGSSTAAAVCGPCMRDAGIADAKDDIEGRFEELAIERRGNAAERAS